MTGAGERLFCDTDVLLSAVDRRRELHAQALHVLNVLPDRGVALCVSGQIVREFLVVCTRSVDANGLGLSRSAAVRNAEAIVGRSTVLEENRGVAGRLLEIVRTTACTGERVHDANVVATMQEHGLTRLVTADLSDFRRFDGVELVDLAELPTDAAGSGPCDTH